MITRDPQKEFQLNPLTAIVPFHGDFTALSNSLSQVDTRHQELNQLLQNPEGLVSYNEQAIKRLQCEFDMLEVILTWSGRTKSS